MDSFRCLMHKSDVVKVCFILVEIKRNTLDLYCSEEYIYMWMWLVGHACCIFVGIKRFCSSS